MSLDLLTIPPGAIDGAELMRRLDAAGWARVKSTSSGFVNYRCPVHYPHDRPSYDPHDAVGPDGHRRFSWEPSSMFSTWHAVREILEFERWCGRPIVGMSVVFVPWIAAERAISHAYCFTCGARTEEGQTPVIRLSGRGGGAQWICVPCGEKVAAVVAELRGAR